MSNELKNEVAELFASFQNMSVKFSDMQIVDGSDDSEIDEQDLARAHEVCRQALLASAFIEVTENAKQPIWSPTDYDKVAFVVEAQLAMAKLSERQTLLQEGADRIQVRLDEAKAGDYLPREQFMALVDKKNELIGEKLRLRDLWVRGKDACQKEVNGDKAIWGKFFGIEDHEEWLEEQLAHDDVNKYFTSGETNSVDEGELLIETEEELLVELAEAHLEEMKEFDKPELETVSLGSFWDRRQEWKYERRAAVEQIAHEEDNSFWNAVRNEELVYVYGF